MQLRSSIQVVRICPAVVRQSSGTRKKCHQFNMALKAFSVLFVASPFYSSISCDIFSSSMTLIVSVSETGLITFVKEHFLFRTFLQVLSVDGVQL